MSDVIWSPDHPQFGCLPRRSRSGELAPRASERIQVYSDAECDEFAKQITLRPHVKTILNQGQVGSCAAESSVLALMIARVFAGLPHVVLNPYFVYHTTSGGRDQGSNIEDNLEFLIKYGCAPESVWPRSMGWQRAPSAEAKAAALEFRIDEYFDCDTIAEMKSGLVTGFPAVHGANGHAVCAVQHMGSYPLIGNTWGTGWGDRGFGKWVNYSAINWSYGAYLVRVAKQ